MSAKLATPGLLRMKVLRNQVHDVIISFHGVIKKLFSLDINYIVDVDI